MKILLWTLLLTAVAGFCYFLYLMDSNPNFFL